MDACTDNLYSIADPLAREIQSSCTFPHHFVCDALHFFAHSFIPYDTSRPATWTFTRTCLIGQIYYDSCCSFIPICLSLQYFRRIGLLFRLMYRWCILYIGYYGHTRHPFCLDGIFDIWIQMSRTNKQTSLILYRRRKRKKAEPSRETSWVVQKIVLSYWGTWT